MKKVYFFGILCLTCLLRSYGQQEANIVMDNLYPWCIVAFDAKTRSPQKRIQLLKKLKFSKYAYDWRYMDLKDMDTELQLAKENEIEVISVWLWLNAKRDSISGLSPANDSIFKILGRNQLKTTLWLSFSSNFFEGRTQKESLEVAKKMISLVSGKAREIDCNVALYNHRGWFGNPENQITLIEELPELHLRMVHNFHHAHDYLTDYPRLVKKMKPYLSWVNLNGMIPEGPKILPIGEGTHEKEMIQLLLNSGFNGPWGILGHVSEEDVKKVLEQNLSGLNNLDINWKTPN